MTFTEMRECPDCGHRIRVDRESWPGGDTVWCAECDTIPRKIEGDRAEDGMAWGPDPNP